MDRRSFLTRAMLGTAATTVTALAAPALSQGRIAWRMQVSPASGMAGDATDAARLAARIGTLSEGLLTVRLVTADDAAPSGVALDAVIAGQTEMGHGPVQAWQNRSEALPFLAGMPFGLTAPEMATWLQDPATEAMVDAVHDTFGVKALLCGDAGPQSGGWFRTALSGIEDLQGLRLLSAGLSAQVWRMIGLSPVAMAADETLAALLAGALDGIEFASGARDLDMGFHAACKHYYAMSFTRPATAFGLIIDKQAYLDLPPSLQDLLRRCCAEAYRDSLARSAASDAVARQGMAATYGVTVHPVFPDSILQAGGKAASEIIRAQRDSADPLARRIAESYVAALVSMPPRTEAADAAYLAARARFLLI